MEAPNPKLATPTPPLPLRGGGAGVIWNWISEVIWDLEFLNTMPDALCSLHNKEGDLGRLFIIL